MTFQMKDNSFNLFKNDKEGKEARPDYQGKIRINGKEMRLAAWIKEGQNGKFMSGKVSEFETSKDHPETREAAGMSQEDLDSSVPF